jgi:hypothetical protein
MYFVGFLGKITKISFFKTRHKLPLNEKGKNNYQKRVQFA